MALSRDTVGLIFHIDADGKPAVQEMEKLKTEIGKSAKNTQAIVRESFETLSSEIIESFGIDGDIANSIANQLVVVKNAAFIITTAVVGAVAAIGFGFVAAANKAAELGDQINDLRQITGLTAETLSGLNLAAAEEGKQLSSLTDILVTFNKNLIDAQRGGKELQGAFKQLGVDFRGDTDQALRQAITRISQMDDGARKAAAAQKVFGDGAAELIPVFNNLEGGIDGAVEKAKELGLFFDTEGAESAEQYKYQIIQLGLQFDGLVTTIGKAVIPALTGLTIAFRLALKDLQNLANFQLKGSIFEAFIKDVVSGRAGLGLLTETAANIATRGGQLLEDVTPDVTPPPFKPAPIGGAKKEKKIEEFDLGKRDAQLLERLAREELDREIALNKLRENAEREHRQALEQINREFDERTIALIERDAEQRVITEQQAAEQIGAIRIAAFRQREDQLKQEIDIVREQLRANAEGEQTEVAKAIREELLAEEQAFLDELELLQARRARIEEEAVDKVIEARRRDIDNLIETQERRRQLRAEQLQDQGFTGVVADAIAGLELLLGRTLTLREQFQVTMSAIVSDAQSTLPKLSQIFIQSAAAITESVAAIVGSFISGQSSVRQAAAAFYKAALQPLVDFLLKKARAEFAIAIAEAAAFNFIGAAKHAAAGLALTAAAGFINAGGAAIAGGGGGTVAPGSSFSGGSSQQQGGRIIEQGDRQRPEPIVIILRAEEGIIAERVMSNYSSNGGVRSLIRRDILGEQST